MNLTPKVSVVLPVYNTAEFLPKCLDYLSIQTLEDVEFILVDDGSTDKSGIICEKYASKDSRFKVIHQRNEGSASARQVGLNEANGEYVIICDSDDWIEIDIYEKLYRKAKETNADIVTCSYFTEYANGKSIPIQYTFKENDGIVDNFDFIRNGAGSSWIKLIRKSLYKETNSNYEAGINLSEDSLIHYKLMRGNPKVVQIRECLYHYRRQFGGTSYTNNLMMSHIDQLQFTYNWLKDNYTQNEFMPIIRQRAIDLGFAFVRTKDMNHRLMKKFLSTEILWRDFFKDRMSLKKIMVYSQKVLPISVSKLIFKTLYPVFYK